MTTASERVCFLCGSAASPGGEVALQWEVRLAGEVHAGCLNDLSRKMGEWRSGLTVGAARRFAILSNSRTQTEEP